MSIKTNLASLVVTPEKSGLSFALTADQRNCEHTKFIITIYRSPNGEVISFHGTRSEVRAKAIEATSLMYAPLIDKALGAAESLLDTMETMQ